MYWFFKLPEAIHGTLTHDTLDEFDDWDVVFTFVGSDNNPVEFRCDARYFLGRLWQIGGKVLAPIRATSNGDDAGNKRPVLNRAQSRGIFGMVRGIA